MNEPANLEKVTVEELQKFSPDVRNLRVTVGHDSTGDPAVYLTVILSDKVSDQAVLKGKFRNLEKWIRRTLWDEGGYQFRPYVTLRREEEEHKLAGAQ
jgi:hypothetical protein